MYGKKKKNKFDDYCLADMADYLHRDTLSYADGVPYGLQLAFYGPYGHLIIKHQKLVYRRIKKNVLLVVGWL